MASVAMDDKLYYIYNMRSDKRKAARVFTETEAKKLKGQVVLCGAAFHLKAHVYGLLYCKPEDREHWIEYAKNNTGIPISWRDGRLHAPNGKIIAMKVK